PQGAEDELLIHNDPKPHPRGPRSCTSIIEEAVCIHDNLKIIVRENSVDENLSAGEDEDVG
ncbi:hypothetical protein U1Q18_027891, partial [Sarracenia purpurea var. burkii]